MRELERNARDTPTPIPARGGLPAVGVVGAGRLGTALAAALRESGYAVDGPVGRHRVPAGQVILLCVPDGEIRGAATVVAGAAEMVGHTSGATPLAELEPAARAGAEVFGLHPLQTFVGAGVSGGEAPFATSSFAGCGCAVAGSSGGAAAAATAMARRLGMTPFALADEHRPAYHAAASMASNFLVTLEAAAERVACDAGLAPDAARALLAPLVRTTVENWAALGPREALTGPVARGDAATVVAQRIAVAEADSELLPLFDALLERTLALAGRSARGGTVA